MARQDTYQRLRQTIFAMPAATCAAMLTGVTSHRRVICGAYVDRDGGVCPILLAQRNGAPAVPTRFAVAFDAFCDAPRGSNPQLVSALQRRILIELLTQRVMPLAERRTRPSRPTTTVSQVTEQPVLVAA